MLTNIYKKIRWFAYTKLNKDIKFKTPNGLKYISMPQNYSSKIVYFKNYRDPQIQKFMEKHIKVGSVFVDAGANIGTYTIPASKLVGESGKVVAIEAHPVTFKYLTLNKELNSSTNALLVNVALGATNGEIELSYNQNNPGETHIATANEEKVTVPMKTLDNVLGDLNISTVNYLKIDVEGFEYFLLQGSDSIIKSSTDIIIQTELNNAHSQRYGNSPEKMIELLESYSLVPHCVDNDGIAKKVDARTTKEDDVLWWRE